MPGQEVRPTRTNRFVAENPPVSGLGYRDQSHDAGLDVVGRGQAGQEQGRDIVGHVGAGIVDALHRLNTLSDQAVNVVPPAGWYILLGPGHVQEAVRVGLSDGRPLGR